jgi:hypothetical protein
MLQETAFVYRGEGKHDSMKYIVKLRCDNGDLYTDRRNRGFLAVSRKNALAKLRSPARRVALRELPQGDLYELERL